MNSKEMWNNHRHTFNCKERTLEISTNRCGTVTKSKKLKLIWSWKFQLCLPSRDKGRGFVFSVFRIVVLLFVPADETVWIGSVYLNFGEVCTGVSYNDCRWVVLSKHFQRNKTTTKSFRIFPSSTNIHFSSFEFWLVDYEIGLHL
jgi:hypothetical protein